MTVSLSTEEARRALAAYHFTATDIPGVLDRLGTIQYDPLNPVGRNSDLVFQARVPDYRVDDWQQAAYVDRIMYDAWDKQACLVPIADWPMRAYGRRFHRPWHDNSVADEHPEATEAALLELDRRGPLSSLEFEDRSRLGDGRSWLGPTRIKRILRALWCSGVLATHHREGARHYYDRAERVIPPELYLAPCPVGDAYYRWIITRRHRAAGMLKPGAELAVWEACGDRKLRDRVTADLVESGELIAVQVGEKKDLFHAVPQLLQGLNNNAEANPQVLFLGPLDSFLWDRKALVRLFDFQYAWEVYKPLHQRVWGYYVLPVLYGDRLVGRLDCRLEGNILAVNKWWWEPWVEVDADLLEALRRGTARFLRYLDAKSLRISRAVKPEIRKVIRSAI